MDEIQASFVIEILGRPKEKVEEALQARMKILGEEKGVKIITQKLNAPVPVENSKSLFTAFAEVELRFDSIEILLAALFAYFPSHVEIFRPEKLTLSNTNMMEISNTITQRLHNYDAITKKTLWDKEFVLQRLKEVAPEEYKKLVTQPDK